MRLLRDAWPPFAAMARHTVPPNSMRSAPSSRSISTASACVAPGCLRGGLGGRGGQVALGGCRTQARGRVDLAEVARDDPALEDLLRAGQVSEPRGNLPAGERLDGRQRSPELRELGEHDALERL